MDYSYRERSPTAHNYPPRTTRQRPRPLDRDSSRPRTADGSSMDTTYWLQKARMLPTSLGSPKDDRTPGTRKLPGHSSSQRSRSRDSASYQNAPASPTPHKSTWHRIKEKTGIRSAKESSRSLNGAMVHSGGSRSIFSETDQPSELHGGSPNSGVFSIDSPPAVPPKTTVQSVAVCLSMSPNPIMEQHTERLISIDQHNRKGSVVNGGTVTTTTAFLQQVNSAIDTSTVTSHQPVPNTSPQPVSNISSTVDDPWRQQARDRINYLEQELRKAQQECTQRDHEMAALHSEAEQSKAEIVRLGQALNATRQVLPHEAAAYEEELAAQSALIERLRAKAAESAGIAAEAPSDSRDCRRQKPEFLNRGESWRLRSTTLFSVTSASRTWVRARWSSGSGPAGTS